MYMLIRYAGGIIVEGVLLAKGRVACALPHQDFQRPLN